MYRNCYGFPGANSLTSFYTTNMQVLHNYLYDSTYGAMSIGWGWCEYDGFGYTEAGLVNTNKTGGPYAGTHEDSRGRSTAISTTSRNNKINYNRVEEICTVVNDSGAIYSLGRQGDPGNLPDGGTWYTVNNLTSSPVIDETSNWHPDNWTNYTEMNYNFLDPNPSNKPTTSNNWTNGFHPDEGSTFIKMIGNVVQSKLSHSPGRSRLYEFNNWKRKSDMIAIEGYVDGNNDQNGGPRITFDNYKSEERIWPVKGNEIVLNSGLEDEYTHMIPRSLIADTEFELASNVIMGKGDKLNRRGLLKAEDTVWFAPADTTVFTEGDTMTKAAGDAKTIDAPSAPGAYKLYIVYADSSKGTATSKYTAYVDTSASAVNVEDGKSYEVSAVRPLKLALSKDYTYTLNGKSIVDGYEIATEGSWTLVLSTSSSANTTTIKFTTTVSVANKLLTADVQVAPDGTVRFAYDLNDATKEIWISSSSDGNFVESEKETKASGDKLGMIAPHLPGPYVIYVRSSEGEVLGQSHARVVVRDMTPVDIPRNGLDLWLKADEGVETDSEGNVTGWTNMGSVTAKLVPADVPGSGGDNLGQPSGNPTLKKDGYDYVDFAAMSRPLKYAGFKDYNGKTEMTIFTLANPTTTANNSSDQSGLVYFGLNEAYQTWPANNGWSGINLGIGTNRVNIRFGNANGGVQGGGQSISTTISGLSSVRAQLNGVNRDIYVNDTRIGGGTNATALAGNRPDLGIGYTMAAATPYRFLGRVAQVLIYDRVLTTDEIAKVEAYFNLVKAGGGGPANAVPSGVDKTLLTALIEDVNNLDNTIYTTDSWNAFASALSEAEAAASNNEIEQGAADNAYFALRDAFKALALLPSGSGTAVYGTPVLGGTELDPLWNTTVTLPVIKHLTMANGPTDGSAKVLWDDNNLYVLVRVKDPVLNSSSGSAHEQDSVEIFVDETNIKGTSYGTGMGQYRINYLNAKSFNPSSISAGFESFAKVVDGGYYLEVKIPFKVAVPRNAHKIGFDLQINDAGATGGRQDIIMWHDQTGNSWQNGSQWGVVTLVGKTSDTYEVTFGTEGGNGSVVAEVDNAQITSGASIEAGKDVVFTATPDTGYRVKGWKLNGSAVSGNTSNTYTLESLSAAAAVTVEFEAVTVDKAGLAEAISTAQALSQSAYTPESWQTMQIALQAATLLNANPAATQEQVDGVTQELQEAIAGLVAVTPVNKTGLAAAISTAGGLSQSAYTPESWQTMQTALQAAISVNDDEDATQGEVDVASAALQTAINGLVAVTPVNKALLAAAISIAEALSESAYTSDSWETMQTALAEAISVNEKEDATQQEVDDAKVELQAAIDGLVVEGEDVNKDLLNAVIATAEALSQNAYTAESWQAMQTALEAAISVNDNTDATQSEVDAASAALQTAIDELEVVTPVNKDLLAAVIVAANELNENAYTAQSWQAMKTALDNAISVNDNVNATQDEVNAASAALQTAIDELEAVTPVNKALLEAEISRVQGLSEDDYTAESWQAMQTALTNATSVNANAAATQQQVDAATADLKTAIEELVAVTPSADKTELEAEIEKAQGLNKNDYTAESWQAMQTALTAATSVNEKEDATQQEVDEAKAALKTAIDALEEVSPSVDKTGLEAEISRTQGLSESAYTAESWQAMQTALTAATSVNEKEDATQQEVDEAKAALKTAIDALVAVTPSADKTELAAEIIRAQGLSESAYTAESWQAMKTALTAAISVNANADATQQEVDAAKTALQAAISALVVKTPTYTGGGNSSTPTPAPPTAKVENGAITVVTPKVNAATGEAKAAPITKADIEKALKGTTPDSSGASTVKVEIPAAQGAKAYSVQLPQTVLASETGNSRIQINTGIATATLPANMFASQGVKDSDKMEIVIAKVDKKDLDAGLQAQVADKPVVDLSIKINGKTVEWKNSNAPVTVKIPYEASKKELENAAYLTVWYLDGNGNVIVVPNAKYDSVEKVVTFTTTHFSKYVIAFVQKTFNDIAKYHWIVEPVQVLASKDIVEGTSKEEFSPDKNITRGEFIMWLVKTLGLTAEFDTNFNDVKSTDIYYEQLGIAKKLGIAQGGGGNTYNPGKEISRQDMMALTIRAMKAAGRDLPVGTESDIERFEDASKVASYAIDHVSTMVKAKLIQGSGKNLNPTAQTTRAEVAIMLYRIYANK
ncbi:sugar-binding protein [Anaerobacterium chartisolvens]|uniref:sugar-binding protein n=1 Tax=Anaerobacterium chartisolvens TaxID=1297424 RepID=UPI001FA89232|nr:sugar-binding protein [Anaerobacterium chartisolvens]